jgi:hypothetical protein
MVLDVIRQIPDTIKGLDYALKETRMVKKTKETYHYGKKSPFILNHRGIMFIPCKINGEKHLVFYDSGQSDDLAEFISSDTLFPRRCKTLETMFMTYSKQSITIKTGLKYYDLESDFFDIKQDVGHLIYISSDTIVPKCESKKTYNRGKFTITPHIFLSFHNIMLLNFSDTSITILDSTVIYDTTDFTLIKSKFFVSRFQIYLTVDSIEYKFLFDTGSELFLSLPDYEKHKKDDDIHIAGYYGKDLAGLLIDTLVEQQTNSIKMGDLDSIKGTILYVKGSTMPNMGMKFISNFDWIIDEHREKVYTKKIKDAQPFEMDRYRVTVFDTTLQISLLPVGETKYQLFSIIDSVNEEKVTANNICQMRTLLNKEDGFKNNRIVVRDPEK